MTALPYETNKREWVICLRQERPCDTAMYLGCLNGIRQGVSNIDLALRFTFIGAQRVRAQYPGSFRMFARDDFELEGLP